MAKNGCSIAERPFFYWRLVGGRYTGQRAEFALRKAYRKFIWKKLKKGVDKIIPIVYNIINPRGKELILWRF